MKKNKQEIKEKQMVAAIKAMSSNPLGHYPDEEEFRTIAKLLIMAYEDYPRFASFGMVCWRDYQKARIEEMLVKEKKALAPYVRAAEFMEKDRKVLEEIRKNPVLNKQLEKSMKSWRKRLKGEVKK